MLTITVLPASSLLTVQFPPGRQTGGRLRRAEVKAEAEAEAGMGKAVKKVSGREGDFRSADQTDNHDADVGDAATTTDSADDRREGEDAERPRKTVLNSISTLPFRSVLPRMRHRRHLPAAWASAYVPRRK